MLHSQLVDRLFVRMQNNYGLLWSGRFSTPEMLESGKKEWAYRLAKYDKKTLARAIDLCWDNHKKAPSLSEFEDYCKQAARSSCEAHRMYRPDRMLQNWSTGDVAKKECESMHSIINLGGGPV